MTSGHLLWMFIGVLVVRLIEGASYLLFLVFDIVVLDVGGRLR